MSALSATTVVDQNGHEAQPPVSWAQANNSVLLREFARLKQCLGAESETSREGQCEREDAGLCESMRPESAIDSLAGTFGLTAFERDIFLLSAGVELDSSLAERCAQILGRPTCTFITFALVLATLPDPHWSALAPTSPLRRYRLLEMEAGNGLTSAPLRVDERMLHYLLGSNLLDSRLQSILRRKTEPACLTEEHQALLEEILDGLRRNTDQPTVIHLCGNDFHGQEGLAATLARSTGRELYVLSQDDMPPAGAETEQFMQLWTRESELLPAVLLLQLAATSSLPSARPISAAAMQLMEHFRGPLLIAGRDPFHLRRALARYDVNRPEPAGQKRLWQAALGPAAESLTEHLEDLAEQFQLSAETIFAIGKSLASELSLETPELEPEKLWTACRSVACPHLEDLAERVDSRSSAVSWDDLILPEAQKLTLRQLASQSRQRMKVYEGWGFAMRGRRGLGLSALFSGPSGTGKTMAAEVVARELKLDLYRIDLSCVVSKYIGETEKNLKRIFDAAETGGVVLLFDEADALFGKRAEVKDSHDRYANIEVSYLLQRMENFQGLAILTTNLKTSLDKAFQRRLRFVVDFPFPDATQREAIWNRIFPTKTPTARLNTKRLAQLNMTGGNIRNIALNAAFLAAEGGQTVEMTHVLHAARLEAIKTERPLSEAEIRGWV